MKVGAGSLKKLIKLINLWPDWSKRTEKGPEEIKLQMREENYPSTPQKYKNCKRILWKVTSQQIGQSGRNI